MWNDKTEGLRNRITHLSNEELLQMVNLDHEQYRKEALDYARAEIERRGLKIDPVTFTEVETGATDSEYEDSVEATNSEYLDPLAEIAGDACNTSRVEFKIFRGAWTSWEELFSEAAAFATEIGSLRLIGISHSSSGNDGVVTVWYWT